MMHSMGFPPQSFQPHIALALQLIALVSGILLINKASTPDFFCKKTGKIVGGFVAIVSILTIICIGYLTFQRYRESKVMPPRMMPSTMPSTMPSGWQHPPIDAPMGMPSEPGSGLKEPKPKGEK